MAGEKKQEIILGAGEVYMYEFTGTTIPEDATIETDEHNVGYCSGGFSFDYKPDRYDVKNQYNRTVKSFISSEDISVKTGILNWDLEKIALLGTARFTKDTTNNTRTLTFGGGGSLKTVLLRFVHVKEDGKNLRLTLIGQGGNGFSLEFSDKETTIDADIQAIEHIKGFLAELEEEVAPAANSVTE